MASVMIETHRLNVFLLSTEFRLFEFGQMWSFYWLDLGNLFSSSCKKVKKVMFFWQLVLVSYTGG